MKSKLINYNKWYIKKYGVKPLYNFGLITKELLDKVEIISELLINGDEKWKILFEELLKENENNDNIN